MQGQGNGHLSAVISGHAGLAPDGKQPHCFLELCSGDWRPGGLTAISFLLRVSIGEVLAHRYAQLSSV